MRTSLPLVLAIALGCGGSGTPGTTSGGSSGGSGTTTSGGGGSDGGGGATGSTSSTASTGSGGATGSTTSSSGSTSTSATACGAAGEACCGGSTCDAGLACDGAQCGPAVTAHACPPGAPEAVFVSEVAPPSSLAPWERPFASVTYANCGTAPWTAVAAGAPDGVKLGAAAPHDAETWTSARIPLPADVAPGQKVTVVIPVQAPPLTGPHPYRYELVREGVAWLGDPSPAHTIDVQAAPAAPVSICAGVTADPSGVADATAAIQSCIDAAPDGGTVALPPGIYRISGVVAVSHPITLATAGLAGSSASCLEPDAPPCAVLRAAPDTLPSAAGTRGFVRLGGMGAGVVGAALDHVVVDGNRGARLGSAAASACASGNNGDGINIGADCAGCSVTGVASARALCGSGLEWDGHGAVIRGSVFFGNGDHLTQNMWSDGLTIHTSDGAVVQGCRFIDNSDVGFISGGGVNAQYSGNRVLQLAQPIFAGLMLDNFNNGAIGDFTGAALANNTVVCAVPCHFGIELGPRPWYPSPNIRGGSVTGNTVVGAHIQINVQGAGTAPQPIVVAGNTLGPTPAKADFLCGPVSGLSPLNVAAGSFVDLQGGSATGSISVPCP